MLKQRRFLQLSLSLAFVLLTHAHTLSRRQILFADESAPVVINNEVTPPENSRSTHEPPRSVGVPATRDSMGKNALKFVALSGEIDDTVDKIEPRFKVGQKILLSTEDDLEASLEYRDFPDEEDFKLIATTVTVDDTTEVDGGTNMIEFPLPVEEIQQMSNLEREVNAVSNESSTVDTTQRIESTAAYRFVEPESNEAESRILEASATTAGIELINLRDVDCVEQENVRDALPAHQHRNTTLNTSEARIQNGSVNVNSSNPSDTKVNTHTEPSSPQSSFNSTTTPTTSTNISQTLWLPPNTWHTNWWLPFYPTFLPNPFAANVTNSTSYSWSVFLPPWSQPITTQQADAPRPGEYTARHGWFRQGNTTAVKSHFFPFFNFFNSTNFNNTKFAAKHFKGNATVNNQTLQVLLPLKYAKYQQLLDGDGDADDQTVIVRRQWYRPTVSDNLERDMGGLSYFSPQISPFRAERPYYRPQSAPGYQVMMPIIQYVDERPYYVREPMRAALETRPFIAPAPPEYTYSYMQPSGMGYEEQEPQNYYYRNSNPTQPDGGADNSSSTKSVPAVAHTSLTLEVEVPNPVVKFFKSIYNLFAH